MSEVFDIASRYVDEVCELSPLLATSLGVGDANGEWDDFGPAGMEERRSLWSRYKDELEAISPTSEDDRLAARVMLADFEGAEDDYSNRDHLLALSHMASPFQQIRSAFQSMPSGTPEEIDAIGNRLSTIDRPLSGIRTRLEEGIAGGHVVARRQVVSVIEQARRLASEDSSLYELPTTEGIDLARSAYLSFADWLEAEYLPVARHEDAVGRRTYERAADRLVGIPIDALETYEWGWEEFFRLRDEMAVVAERVLPGAAVLEAKEHLESHPSVVVASHGELLRFVATVLDEAVERLAGSHFDVPDEIRTLTVQMAPKGGPLGVYYMRPSEDFERPGGVWYSTGDQTIFPLYQHRSTAYHEGFPGHHLQIATMMINADRLSRYQRVMTWCPGFGEGWAMYAEVLMGELGFLEVLGDHFGMLAKQMYRAARVVVDIGLHLGLDINGTSPIAPGQKWTFETACEFMEVYGFRTAAQARDEVLRYLGWPGQAIAYKLGEREILRLREQTESNLDGQFSLREFHSAVLSTGTVRLDILADTIGQRVHR